MKSLYYQPLISRRFFLIFLSSLLVALGISGVANSSPLKKKLDFCAEAVTKENRILTTHFSRQMASRNSEPFSTKVREPHYITMFSIEDLQVSSESFEQARQVFADPDALEWDLYLQRQAQIEYLKNHLPDTVLSRITDVMWSDFYYGQDTQDIEEELLPHLDRISLRGYQLIQPTRLRAISRFNLHFDREKWEVQQVKAGSFEQNYALSIDHQQDFRIKEGRKFKELNLESLSGVLIKILEGLGSLIHTYDPEILHLEASVHFMKIIKQSESSQIVTNSPEGIHQDGMDFVVSALVIDRENIQGGQSLIYDARGAPLREDGHPDFREQTPDKDIVLLPGYGLLHRDRGSLLWHEVTPIELQDPSREGYRSIIGIDFQIK